VRAQKNVRLTDASAVGETSRFRSDAYLRRVRPKSVLCVPIVRGAKVIGVFYLENNLVSYLLTPERVGSVELLASQAAITVEVAFRTRQEQEARVALERSESRFRRLSDSKLLGVVILDRQGRILEANDYFLEMLGCSRDDFENGLRSSELTPPEYAPLDGHALAELERSGVCRPYEKEFRRRDGARVPVLVAAAYIEGQREEAVGYVLDISERRHAQRERDRLLVQEQGARAQAEAALRARDEFMSIAAHELRTPLTPLKMQIDVLARLARRTLPPGTAGADRLLTMLEASSGQLTRLVALIGELLDVSTIRTGHLTLTFESIDLVELVRAVLERYRMALEMAGSSVTLVAPDEVRGRWDRLRLEQVVANLLTNAMKYGSGKPIEVEVAVADGQAKLTVVDHGIGIDETDRDRIFERFERAVPVRHFGGFGLGLYITRQIVRAHGGTIQIEGGRGAGSAFIVRLPLVTDVAG
jgi:PAS domain S-box-containing protein